MNYLTQAPVQKYIEYVLQHLILGEKWEVPPMPNV
jgi:hypothetical protein